MGMSSGSYFFARMNRMGVLRYLWN